MNTDTVRVGKYTKTAFCFYNDCSKQPSLTGQAHASDLSSLLHEISVTVAQVHHVTTAVIKIVKAQQQGKQQTFISSLMDFPSLKSPSRSSSVTLKYEGISVQSSKSIGLHPFRSCHPWHTSVSHLCGCSFLKECF